jgi:hypothetical protein
MRTPDDDDARLEGNLGALALRPTSPATELVQELLKVAMGLDAQVPGVGAMIKGLAAVGAWAWNVRKVERVRDTLVGLYERLQRTRFEFVGKEEFQDILEETVRRLSEQPDPERRRTLRSIFEKILETPLEHCENRLFLRLADELPSGALRLLSIVDDPVAPSERTRHMVEVLAEQARLSNSDAQDSAEELAAAQILRRDIFRFIPSPGKPLDHILTTKGRAFVDYCRG